MLDSGTSKETVGLGRGCGSEVGIFYEAECFMGAQTHSLCLHVAHTGVPTVPAWTSVVQKRKLV